MSNHTQAILERTGQRANITFRTEAGLNVASMEFMHELDAVLDELAHDDNIRFAVFRAEGKAFMAGANIKAMANYNPTEARTMADLGHAVFDKLEALPQVTVAALQGAALGGGCEFAMACDFRIAVKTINIGQPEVLLGLIPGWGGTKRLTQLVGLARAKRMMFTGDSLKGEQALQIGLIDEVVNSEEDLEPLVGAFLTKMVKAGPQAIAEIKLTLQTADEIGGFVRCFQRSESKEGMAAFLEKRPTPWSEK